MRLLSLHVQNFRLHADTKVAFPPDGVTGIIGANETGKTALLEAIVWALFGGDTTRGTMAGLRWHRAPVRHVASATLRFEVGGKTYRIERSETGAKTVDEGSGAVLAQGQSAVNDHTPQILGMNHAEFRSSFLCTQKDLNRLATMMPTERVGFVRQVLGMGRIDAALTACRKKKAALAEELRGITAGLGQRQPVKVALEEAVADLVRTQSRLTLQEEAAAKAKDAERAAAERLREMAAAKQEADRISAALATVAHRIVAAGARVTDLAAVAARQERAQAFVQESEDALAELPELREERDTIRDMKVLQADHDRAFERARELRETALPRAEAQVESAQEKIARHDQAALEQARATFTAASEKLTALRESRVHARGIKLAGASAAENEAAALEGKVAVLRAAGEDGECPTCTRRLAEHFDAVVGAIEEQIQAKRVRAHDAHAAAEDLAHASDEEVAAGAARSTAEREMERLGDLAVAAHYAEAHLPKLLADLAAAKAELAEVEAVRKDLAGAHFDADRLAEVEGAIEVREALAQKVAEARGVLAGVDETARGLTEARAEAEEAEEEREALDREREALGFDASAHTEAKTLAADTSRARQVADTALAGLRATVAAAVARRDDRERALDEWDERAGQQRTVREAHLLHERVDARLSEFRVAVASTIRPELEELMSGFVHTLTDGRHEAVTLTDDFQAVLHESGVVTEVVSGGTEDIASLALRLAISQMIAERAGHPLSLLILDEPFGSLDETRRANVLELIRRLRSVFPQVVVISHVGETRDAVDHAIELEFDEPAGRTRVVTAPAPTEEAA